MIKNMLIKLFPTSLINMALFMKSHVSSPLNKMVLQKEKENVIYLKMLDLSYFKCMLPTFIGEK